MVSRYWAFSRRGKEEDSVNSIKRNTFIVMVKCFSRLGGAVRKKMVKWGVHSQGGGSEADIRGGR